MVKIVAVIPARGGSKRIPQKNIHPFMGRPLLAWTVGAALHSDVFARVLVSTDSEEIADAAKKAGAECPFLRGEACGDNDKAVDATLHALGQLESYHGEQYDIVAQLMPNCPLRTGQTIAAMYSDFNNTGADFMISVFAYGWMNPWWALRKEEGGTLEPLFSEALKSRSQDLPELVCPTGAIWIAKKDALQKSRTFYGPGYRAYDIGWQEAVDIDNYEDLEFARAVYLMRNNKVYS